MQLVNVTLRDNGKGLLHILEAEVCPIHGYDSIGDWFPLKEENAAKLLNNSSFAVGKKIFKPNNKRKDLSDNVRHQPKRKPKANRP